KTAAKTLKLAIRRRRDRPRSAAMAAARGPFMPCAARASLDAGRALGERPHAASLLMVASPTLIGPSQVGLDLTSRNPIEDFAALMRRQLMRPTKSNAAGLGADATLVGAFADQLPLELSDASKNRDQQPTVHRRRVCPRILERAESGATFG